MQALKHEEYIDLAKQALNVALAMYQANPSPETAKTLQDQYKMYLDAMGVNNNDSSNTENFKNEFNKVKQSGLFNTTIKASVGDPVNYSEKQITMNFKELTKWLKNQKNT